MDDIVLMADPRVARVPVIDTGSPLIDADGWLRIDLAPGGHGRAECAPA